MKNYELVVIIQDNESIVNETVKEIQDILASKEIKINNQNNWGSRKLAYPIKKQNNGFYILFEITGPGNNVKDIEKSLIIKENILRFRIFKEEPAPKEEKKHE